MNNKNEKYFKNSHTSTKFCLLFNICKKNNKNLRKHKQINLDTLL